MESLWRLENVPLGFHPERNARSIDSAGSQPLEVGRQQKLYQHDALDRVFRLPGLSTAAIADSLPPTGSLAIQTFSHEDRSLPEPGHRRQHDCAGRQQRLFPRHGDSADGGRRRFNSEETRESLVAVVNRALVRRYFPNEEPIGKRIGGLRPEPEWKTIVGGIADGENAGLMSNPQPKIYLPFERKHMVEDAWLVPRNNRRTLSNRRLGPAGASNT
jgi:hypothetical protein